MRLEQDRSRARSYSRLKDRLALLGMALSLLAPALFVFRGGARQINERLLPGPRPSLRQRLTYSIVLSAAGWLASLPFSFFNDHIVERRYDLSNQPAIGWWIDALKAKAISAPLELGVIEGAYAAIGRWPARWWLVCSAAVVPLSALLAQLFPVLIAPRFNRYEPLRDRQLAKRLQQLAADAGVPIADVLQMDLSRRTSKANAFFAGLGHTRRIVLADTLLDKFTPDEIEGIVAHELAHQLNGDIWRFIALSGAFTLATTVFVDRVARGLLRAMPSLTGTNDLANRRSLPVLALVTALAGVALTPLQLAYSRHIERVADRHAMRLTNNPSAYANAMRRLATTNLADSNPPTPVVLLLHSHPPLAERIEAAENIAYQQMFGTT
ncbi:MAG TPA: M48 family metallopeptidase [Thermomicrobiales bacterium]|nr:M48 family metallopeptidase [Thermomicrobiales bacterium]